jgi:uncharacterized protein YodC (DUF2158 family)
MALSLPTDFRAGDVVQYRDDVITIFELEGDMAHCFWYEREQRCEGAYLKSELRQLVGSGGTAS